MLGKRVALLVALSLALSGCYADELAGAAAQGGAGPGAGGGGTGGSGGSGTTTAALACRPTKSSEPLPARAETMSPDVAAGAQPVFLNTLYSKFKANCGACHVDRADGDHQVTLQSFEDEVGAEDLARMRDADVTRVMPPLGVLLDDRPEGHTLRQLAAWLEAWLAQGKSDIFYPDAADPDQSPELPFLLTDDVAQTLTNIGNCVPQPNIVGEDVELPAALDAMFASATELPSRLEQTDMTSLDSEVLARSGVIGYAPTYPLWSNDARKIRYVRVPRGKSIRYVPETAEFDVPDNTRFYKTFLKRVVDGEGNIRFRKMETRLIVARQDHALADGSFEPRALYGTYQWNDSETEAVLVTEPRNDGTPFTDVLKEFVVDERRAQEILAGQDIPESEKLATLKQQGLVRTYAIPGSTRCVQCHMGSPSQDFVLGFTPLQVHRRPAEEGGVNELVVGADELSQLDRLIDYGVVTGLESAADIVLLEDSQGDRSARNDYELKAQGYMYGNCSHCHNPRGFPTTRNPALGELLNFRPSTSGGGIFEFPLDRISPSTHRGQVADVDVPYITPALEDIYERPEEFAAVRYNPPYKTPTDDATLASQNSDVYAFYDGYVTKHIKIEINGQPVDTGISVDAPWRSLIWRNVSTPFTYSDHFAFFPHMPMNVPGFDCNAHRILGDWMVSIPARVIDGEAPTALTGRGIQYGYQLAQPYEEVKPGARDYAQAVKDAEARLRKYHTGQGDRYQNYCPNTFDIINDELFETGGETITPKKDPQSVPEQPHWVITDLTQAQGVWVPKRGDWKAAWQALRDESVEAIDASDDSEAEKARRKAEKAVVHALDGAELTAEFHAFALEDRPFGTWLDKPSCDFSSTRTVGEALAEPAPPRWLRILDTTTEPAAKPELLARHVYDMSPGGAVYMTICGNCHGPKADADSRLAGFVMDLTGGAARVANFRAGLFGFDATQTTPSNYLRVFGSGETAARYLSWMALGGTRRLLPESVLTVVGATPVMGYPRSTGRAGTANMLATAQILCGEALGFRELAPTQVRQGYFHLADATMLHALPEPLRRPDGSVELPPVKTSARTLLIDKVGEAEVWEGICSAGNPLPVRVLGGDLSLASTPRAYNGDRGLFILGLYARSAYPADSPVGDHQGRRRSSLTADNRAPWCVVSAGDRTLPDAERPEPLKKQIAELGLQGYTEAEVPWCPPGLAPSPDSAAQSQAWALRGAINAGYAVFSYLKDGKFPLVAHNECEKLAAGQ